MVGSSKILTVSYGTFSCTLEGFDDSFHSMKAIAEYFRDLAQEDRYFGAEPPTPDAEMLARIAEREISRRVEAQMDDSGIRLTAAPQAQVADADVTMPPAAEAPEAEIAKSEAPAASDVVTQAGPSIASAFKTMSDLNDTSAATTPAPTAETNADASSVAAKLQRIRAVVGKSEDANEDGFEDAPASAFVAPQEPAVEDAEVATEEVEEAEATADIVAEAEEATEAAVEHDAVDEQAEAPEIAEETPAVEAFEEVATEEVEEETPVVEAEEEVSLDAHEADEAEEAAAEAVEAVAQDEAQPNDIAADATEAPAFDDPLDDPLTAEVEAAPEESLPATDDESLDALYSALAQDADTSETAMEDDMSSDLSDTDAMSTDLSDFDDLSSDLNDTNDLSSDLSDIDDDLSADLNDVAPPVAPAPRTTAKARIVRMRKDGPAEVVAADDNVADTKNVAEDIVTDAVAEATTEHQDIDASVADMVAEAEPVATDFDEPYVLDALDALDAEAAETDKLSAIAAQLAENRETEDMVRAEELAVEDVLADEPFADPSTQIAEIEEETGHDDIRAAIAAAMPAGSLSLEDEDELQRELAAVTEEVVVLEDPEPEPAKIRVIKTYSDEQADVDVAEVDIDDVAEAPEAEAPAKETMEDFVAAAAEMPEVVEAPKSRKILPAPDRNVSRIIAQTDEELNEPAGSRRRNAIAQLKAAVAATEAARQLGDNSNSEAAAQNAFRQDLDEVVRPSRPIINSAAITDDKPRAAPLKLVASQRVDGEDEVVPAPVPRSRPITPTAGDEGGFAQFAASMGATELPDLLEAAAAYTAFVEGVQDFSRPQIMKKVQMTTSDEFSREDGLRSFGTLLRQGRISKVRNGRFQVSEQTRFRPDARSA